MKNVYVKLRNNLDEEIWVKIYLDFNNELMLDNIDGFTYDKIHLSILTKDKEVFLFTISDVSRVTDELKKKGWITEGLRE